MNNYIDSQDGAICPHCDKIHEIDQTLKFVDSWFVCEECGDRFFVEELEEDGEFFWRSRK